MKRARLIIYEGDEQWITKTLMNSLQPIEGASQGVAMITAGGTISVWELNEAELTLFACEPEREEGEGTAQ